MFHELHSIWELRIYEIYTYFQANMYYDTKDPHNKDCTLKVANPPHTNRLSTLYVPYADYIHEKR
jgi:hypothetical protein